MSIESAGMPNAHPSVAASVTGAASPRKRPSPTPRDPQDSVSVEGSAPAGVGEETLQKIPGWAQKYFTSGNKVTPLFDPGVTPRKSADEIFAQAEQLIGSAEKNIQIEMFNIDKKSMVDLLIKEARKGIQVQVIMDPPNEGWESDRKAAIERLREGGVDVLIYPAKEAGDPQAKFGQLDHVKMLLVDGRKAIIGGMNWGEHSPANHDFDVQVEGPAVAKMDWLFREDWLQSGGKSSDLPRIPEVPAHPEGDAMVNLLVTGLDEREKTVGKTVVRAIENARKSVHAELFVLSDRRTIEALKAAHARGVDVKVILNPLKIKSNPINEKAAAELKQAGIPVRWYDCDAKTGQKLHAKMATFDDDQVIVGSANWSYAGFNTNREADVEVLSHDVNSAFDKVFETDWEKHTTEEPVYLANTNEDAGG